MRSPRSVLASLYPWATWSRRLDPIEELTAAAIDVVAIRYWGYQIPQDERERLGKMRNVREAMAALEFRRRRAEVFGAALAALDDIEDVVDEMLAELEGRGTAEAQLTARIRALRDVQWRRIDGLHPETRVRVSESLTRVYVQALERCLAISRTQLTDG